MRQKWLWVGGSIGLAFLSVFVLVSLSSVSSYASKDVHRPVFADIDKPIELSTDNLVDEMSRLHLPVKLSKVDLRRHILSVDMKLTGDNFKPTLVYKSLAELISFSMGQTNNVYQLLVRVVAEDPWTKNKYLLLAADIRKGQWPMELIQQLQELENEELPREMKTWFRMTETKLWQSHFKKYDVEL
jgi:hypothetical protein